MKKILPFIVMLLTLVNVMNAQGSTSMFPVGTSWSVVHYPCWGYSDLTVGYQMIIGDTIINDTLYQIVTPMGYIVDPYMDYDNPAVYIREEDKKVYIRNNDNREDILYDFTLEAGDSILNLVSSDFSRGILQYNKVTSVEYVTLKDDRIAKSISYDGLRDRDMEYVGNLSGFLSPVSDISTCGDGFSILCCSVGESLLYQSEEAIRYGCDLENYPSSVEDIISKEPVATKYIENDQIFIILGGKRYNLLGAEVK